MGDIYGVDYSEVPDDADRVLLLQPVFEAMVKEQGWHELAEGESVQKSLEVRKEDEVLVFEVS